MDKYLDPKADIIFKKVFGNSARRCTSFLNALLPLKDDEQIVELEYLPSELVPETPFKKNSIVDVRCKDAQGRQFLVEMQMQWSPEFEQRVLYNACKAYVNQIDQGENYEVLEPVYALSLVNRAYKDEYPRDFVHTYEMNNVTHVDDSIKGLSLTFVELPKFKPETFLGKRMACLWLRFLTEINNRTMNAPEELLAEPDIAEALGVVERCAFTEQELYTYDKFWDAVRVESAIVRYNKELGLKQGYAEGLEKGMAEGLAEGLEKGIAEGIEKGMAEGIEKGMAEGIEKGMAEGIEKGIEKGIAKGLEKGIAEGIATVALNMKKIGMTLEQISQATGLSAEEISRL